MKTRVRIDRSTAAPENAHQERFVFRKKGNTSATSRVHQRAFNYGRRPAPYTFHNVTYSNPFSRAYLFRSIARLTSDAGTFFERGFNGSGGLERILNDLIRLDPLYPFYPRSKFI